MEKGYESILKLLSKGEDIVFKTDRNFKFGERNLLVIGEKIFCISNLGRIFIADKNKRLKSIKVFEYNHRDKNIKFKVLTKDNIIAINSRDFTDNKTESFVINMKMDDFVNVCRKIEDSPFTIEWSKYTIKIDEGIYEIALLEFREDEISINTISNKVNIKYSEIIDYKVLKSCIHIITNNSIHYNILIHCFNKSATDIKDKIDRFKEKEELKEEVYLDIPMEYTQIMDASEYMDIKDINLYLKDDSEDIKKNNINYKDIEKNNEESEKEEIKIEDDTISKYYEENLKNEGEEILGGDIKEIIAFNEVLDKTKILANIYGEVDAINYKGREIEVIIDRDIKIIDRELDKEILNQKFENISCMINVSIIIFMSNQNLFLIKLKDSNIKLDKYFNKIIATNKYLGYTSEYQPFLANITDERLVLNQGDNIDFCNIEKFNIADINILDSNYMFEEIAITLKDCNLHKLFILKENIRSFVEEIYILKSTEFYSSLEECELREIYLNTKKEFIKLFYFSDMNDLKVLIDEFYKSQTKDRTGIIGLIFAKVDILKKSIDLISMYYLNTLKLSNNLTVTFYKKEFRELCNKLYAEIIFIQDEILKLDIFKNETLINYRNIDFSSDIELELVIKNKEYIILKEIFIDTQIKDFKFDYILLGILERINKVMYIDLDYYIDSIDMIIDNLALESLLCDKTIIKNRIIKFYVDMQFKSKSNDKSRIKDKLLKINKYSSSCCIKGRDILNIAKL